MSTRESSVFTRLKGHICRPGDRFERIENGLGAGWPDVNYCLLGGAEGWIELKAPLLPARESTPLLQSQHQLSQDQANWFLAQHNAGGLGFLFIATEVALVLLGAEVALKCKLVNQSTLEELILMSHWALKLPATDAQAWVKLRGVLRGAR